MRVRKKHFFRSVAVCLVMPISVEAATATYVGPANGSWFVAEHWSTGLVPDALTDVVLALPVMVDQPSGICRDATIQAGGHLRMIGELTLEDLNVQSGGRLILEDSESLLDALTINVRSGAVLEWRAGAVHVHSWFSTRYTDTLLGSEGAAELRLINGAWFDTINLFILSSSAVRGNGTIFADTFNEGTLSPGMVYGTLIIDGDLTQEVTGIIQIDIDSYARNSIRDHLEAEGSLSLGGTLRVEYEDTSAPQIVQFIIIEAASIFGDFDTLIHPDPPGPLEPGYMATDRRVSVGLTVPGARLHVDVDAPPGGFGSSWQDAFQNLDDALTAAAVSDEVVEVWVAEGNYIPSQPRIESDPLTASFRPPANVPIYGGFDGTEDILDERNVEGNPTVLTGDRAGDDLANFGNRTDNCYHVVWADNLGGTSILDGLIVQGGNADQEEFYGGGILATGGALEIRSCTITDNYAAYWGGGINSAELTLTSSTIRGNWARRGGAGISTVFGGTIDDCLFEDNVSQLNFDDTIGGAISITGGLSTITNSVFRNNNAVRGGAIATDRGLVTSISVVNCLFEDNAAGNDMRAWGSGGAIDVDRGGTIEINGCNFLGNTGWRTGGAVSLFEVQNLLIQDCDFVENEAQFSGALLANQVGTGQIVASRFYRNSAEAVGAMELVGDNAMYEVRNCKFDENAATDGWAGACSDWALIAHYRSCRFNGNSASTEGGAIVSASDQLGVSNCTITHNSAMIRGGGILYWIPDPALVEINNNILWDNDVAGIRDEVSQLFINEENLPQQVNYNCIMGFAGYYGGEGNIATDPDFVDTDGADGVAGTQDDDLHLKANSPCIDSADNFSVPVSDTMDLDGEARRFDDTGVVDTGRGTPPIVDMGADEFHGTSSNEATLTDCTVTFGTLISGGLQDLVESDDSWLRVRSRFGFTSAEPNVLDVLIGAATTVQNPSLLDLSVEGRISQSGGTSKLRLRNWSNNALQQVHQYPIGTVETVNAIADVSAANRVRQSDGRIELSIRQSVMVVFTAAGFDSFTDQVVIEVE